jgi:hypothetical protein
VAQGTSDYYVRIHDDVNTNVPLSTIPTGSSGLPLPAMMMVRGASSSDGGASSFVYRPTIYQSDGTPQFWGAHIYRPTQAAVAVTSR